LLNDTVGQHLPRIMKLYNYRYLSTLPRDEQDQVAFHVDQILAIRPEDYLHEFRNIECGLKFLNGELDNYTTPEDARSLSAHLKRAEFLTIEQAGHFLDLEGRAALRQVRTAIFDYFGAPPAQAAGRALERFDAFGARSPIMPVPQPAIANIANVALQTTADHSFQQVELP
jgi:rhamnosyltransferase subunit A